MFSFKEAAKIVTIMDTDERRKFNELGVKLIEVRGNSWFASLQRRYYVVRIDYLLNTVVDRFISRH